MKVAVEATIDSDVRRYADMAIFKEKSFQTNKTLVIGNQTL